MLLDFISFVSSFVWEAPSAAPSGTEPAPADTTHVEQQNSMGVTGAQSQEQSTGLFAGAHHFVINNSTITENLIETGRVAIQLLEHRRISGAEVDSSARYPPPSCHPDTRKELRGKITTWLTDTQRHWRMLWLLGPAGVGKSAVAQSVGEHSRDIGRLGAAFFFSRLNDRNDPLRVIPTLAYQLAVNSPDYKRLVTQLLADDSTILEKNLRSQFKKLLIEPFTTLKARGLFSTDQPLLIILDGLDECKGEEAQCEFIELINEHVRLIDTFPLLWMICSRPEWHLKRLLRRTDFEINCKREELSVDDPEAQRDVRHFLRGGFDNIRQRYWDIIDVEEDKPWPTKTELLRLATTASGLFILASTVLKFIGDEDVGDPVAQLEICLRFFAGSQMLGAVNPLHALDLLYRRILSDVPTHTLPTTMRILGFCILFSNTLPAQSISNLYYLSRSSFYGSLRRLHSVLYIPPPAKAHDQHLRFYHASFGDFLSDSSRSGQSALDVEKVRSEFALFSLRWYNCSNERYCTLDDKSLCCASSIELERMTGVTEENKLFPQSTLSFVEEHIWDTCSHGSDEDTAHVVTELCQFHFCHLSGHSYDPNFARFVNWLYSLGDNGLIRLSPGCDTDYKILEKHGRPTPPAVFPLPTKGILFSYISLHCENNPFLRPKGMFFLGHNGRSCLVEFTYNRHNAVYGSYDAGRAEFC